MPGTSDHLHHRGLEHGPSTATGASVDRPPGPEPGHRLRHLDGHRLGRGHRLQRLGHGQPSTTRVTIPAGGIGHLHGDGHPLLLGHRHPLQHGHGQLPPTPPRSRATDTDTLNAQATLAITKTDNDGGSSVTATKGTAVPGHAITYTIVASNTGPVRRATGARSPTPWPSTRPSPPTPGRPPGRAGPPASALRPGTIDDSVTIPAGGSVTYTRDGHPPLVGHRHPSNTATASRHRRLHGHRHRHRHA